MAGTDKPKSEKKGNSLPDVRPDIEAKVDRMMTGKTVGSADDNKTPDAASKSAPLLPGEKLPDFEAEPRSKGAGKPKAPSDDGEEPTRENPSVDTLSRPETSEDRATDQAVDEIVKEESDRMLAIEDAKAQLLAEGSAEIDRGFFNRLKTKIGGLLKSPKAWAITLFILIAAAGTVMAIPTSRYYALNLAGVRASTSLRVIDDKTRQPLKNVEVSLGGQTKKTDIGGNVSFEGLKLGPQEITIKKPAFADLSQEITVGWGSNPRGDVGLTAVGSRYVFEVTDFVSGQPVKGAEALSGEASATADQKGQIILVVADQDESKVSVEIRAGNYRSEKLNLEVGDKETHKLKLVPSKKHAFVSKRSGTYDLYKIDIDGKNEKLILAGTGSEREDSTIVMPTPDDSAVAYVTTTGESRNKTGEALSDLMIINLNDDKIDKVDSSERIQLISFISNKLIYVKIAQNEGDDSPNRNQIIAYDLQSGEQKVLAKTNYFNDVLSVKDSIYYAPAAYKVNGSVGLYRVNADGNGKNSITGKEVWNMFRISYDRIDVALDQQKWYEYDTSAQSFNALNGAPSVQKSRVYVDSPDGKYSAWVDERDGKGVLIIYDTSTGKDKVLQAQSGLSNPISWLDGDHLVYRVATGSETADYVISMNGGEAKKIKDVTNTAGLDRWYYY